MLLGRKHQAPTKSVQTMERQSSHGSLGGRLILLFLPQKCLSIRSGMDKQNVVYP